MNNHIGSTVSSRHDSGGQVNCFLILAPTTKDLIKSQQQKATPLSPSAIFLELDFGMNMPCVNSHSKTRTYPSFPGAQHGLKYGPEWMFLKIESNGICLGSEEKADGMNDMVEKGDSPENLDAILSAVQKFELYRKRWV